MIHFLSALLASHRLLAVGMLLFVEELGVPFVVPGDFLMVAAGVLVAQHHAALWQVIVVEDLATLAGANVLYLFARQVGRPLVARYGRYVGLSGDRLIHQEDRLQHHGFLTVVVGRLTPGLRMITVAAAGIIGIPIPTFLIALVTGGSIYLLAYTMLGIFFGPPALRVISKLGIPSTVALSLVALALIAAGVHALRRSEAARLAMRGSPSTFLLAGLAAGLTAVLAGNVVFGGIAVVARLSRHGVPFVIAGRRGFPVLLAWPVFLVSAAVVAGAYGYSGLHRWPLLVRFIATALVPLTLTLVLLDPLLDVHGAEVSSVAAEVAAVATVVRWLVFGAVLAMLPAPAPPSSTVEIPVTTH